MTSEPRRRSGAAALVGAVVVVMWGLITHGTHAGSGDEPHYLLAAYSLAFDADLDVSNNYGDPATLIGGPEGLDAGPHAQRGRGDRLRSVHDIGMPLAFAPYVRVAHPAARALAGAVPQAWLARARLTESLLFRHLVSLAMIALTALLAVQIFLALQQGGASPHAAWWWALLVALSPPIVSHGFLFFTEVPSALVVLIVFRRLYGPPPTRVEAVTCGLAIGLLPLIHARNIPLALALAVIAVIRLRNTGTSRLVPLGAAIVAGVAVRTLVTWHFWGTLFTTPHARPGEWAGAGGVAVELAARILGWAWDREYGLFAYAPIYLLAIPGLVLLARRDLALARGITAVVGIYVAAIALPLVNAHGWTGGWSPAARFLVPVAPLLALSAFTAWPVLRPLTWALVAMQVALAALVWQRPKLLWNDGDGIAAFCDVPALPQCAAFPSMVIGSRADWVVAIAASVAAALIAAWIVRRGSADPRGDGVEHGRVHVRL